MKGTIITLALIGIIACFIGISLGLEILDVKDELYMSEIKIADLQAQLEESPGYLHISEESGFLNSEYMMASFQEFGDGEYWFKISRPGYDSIEFGVSTYTEAVMVLKGLY